MNLRISNMSTKFPKKALRVPKLKNLLLATTIATGTLFGVAKYDNYQYNKDPVVYSMKSLSNDLIANDTFYSAGQIVENTQENVSNPFTPHTPKEKAIARLELFANKLGSNINNICTALIFQLLGLAALNQKEKLDEEVDKILNKLENSQ